MSAARVLVVGGTGMLGHKLVQVFSGEEGVELHATARRAPAAELPREGARWHLGVDLDGGSAPLRRVLEEVSPDFVLNAVGAIKQRDIASHPDGTFYLNATLPHLLGLLNPNSDGRVVHFSTDCVFQGDRGGYTEDDAPDMVDLYGRSKACGELDYGPHLTLRTSIIGFEFVGQLGLLSWFFQQPPGSRLRGFTRAIFSGLPTITLARLVARLVAERTDLRGLYHVASEPISKFDLLSRVNDAFGLGHHLEPDDAFHCDRSLDDARFRAATGTDRPDWDTLVRELVEDFASLPYARHYPATAGTAS